MAETIPPVEVKSETAPLNISAPVDDGDDIVMDASPRGGDDDMLEGTEIRTSNADWSDSESEVAFLYTLAVCS